MGQGVGFGSALGAGAGADMLQEVLRNHYQRIADAQRIKQEQQRLDLERQRLAADADYRRQSLDALADQRNATVALRNQQRADRLSAALAPGSALDAGAVEALRSGDLGSLVEHQAATPLRIVGAASAGGPGLTLPVLNPGNPERDVYRGTGTQQEQVRQRTEIQRLMADPNTPDSVRQYLMVAQATGVHGGSLPAALFQSSDQDVVGRNPDGSLVSLGSVPRGARIVNIGGGRPRGGAMGGDNPALPLGAQRYALDIAAKHGTDYNGALAEAQQYLADPQTQQDHPRLSPQKFLAAVQSAMRRPGGAQGSALDRLVDSAVGAAAGGATVSNRDGSGGGPGVSAPKGVVSFDELRQLAARRGTSVEQEKQRASAAGFLVR